jgi:hypothetical protein
MDAPSDLSPSPDLSISPGRPGTIGQPPRDLPPERGASVQRPSVEIAPGEADPNLAGEFLGTPLLGMTESHAPPEAEAMRGAVSYLDFLRDIHAVLSPRLYLEIGVRHGSSLALATAAAIGVDPSPEITCPLSDMVQVVAETSDRFFAHCDKEPFAAPVDLAFVDGMHWFEFALRDFMNIERRAHAASLVMFDDVFPVHPWQADRNRQTRVWTGDIWKIVPCLRSVRPDLVLIPVDTYPTGMLLVAGLKPNDRRLGEQYKSIVREFVDDADGAPPDEVLQRAGAWSPNDGRILDLLELLWQARNAGTTESAIALRLQAWRTRFRP